MSTSNLPTYDLELRAADQRRRLHNSVTELKAQMRDRLDVKKNAREHVLAGSAVAGGLALFLGYGLAGMFTRH